MQQFFCSISEIGRTIDSSAEMRLLPPQHATSPLTHSWSDITRRQNVNSSANRPPSVMPTSVDLCGRRCVNMSPKSVSRQFESHGLWSFPFTLLTQVTDVAYQLKKSLRSVGSRKNYKERDLFVMLLLFRCAYKKFQVNLRAKTRT